MAKYGWRPVFIGIGLLSLLWLPAWIRWMPRGREPASSAARTGGFADFLRQRSFFMLTGFLSIWCASVIFQCKAWRGLQAFTTWWTLYRPLRLACFRMCGSGRAIHRLWYARTVMAIGYTIACVAMAGFAASPQIYLPWLMAAGVGWRDGRFGCFRIHTDPLRSASSWTMGRPAKWFRELCRRGRPCSHGIRSGSDQQLCGSAGNHCSRVNAWRPGVDLRCRAGRAGKLGVEKRTFDCTSYRRRLGHNIRLARTPRDALHRHAALFRFLLGNIAQQNVPQGSQAF